MADYSAFIIASYASAAMVLAILGVAQWLRFRHLNQHLNMVKHEHPSA